MGTAKVKNDTVKRYASISMEISCIEDMRSMVQAYDDMKNANPGLEVDDWDVIDTHEYQASVTDY